MPRLAWERLSSEILCPESVQNGDKVVADQVFVYWNFNRKCWSIRSEDREFAKGRVILHARHLVLEAACPKVSQAGRERVLREQRKNVHAGIVGRLVSLCTVNGNTYSRALSVEGDPDTPLTIISYNPYRGDSFRALHHPQERVEDGTFLRTVNFVRGVDNVPVVAAQLPMEFS